MCRFSLDGKGMRFYDGMEGKNGTEKKTRGRGRITTGNFIEHGRRCMDLSLFVVALGLLFIIEGIPYFAFPEMVKRFMAQALTLPDGVLRIFGLAALTLGLLLLYLGTRVIG